MCVYACLVCKNVKAKGKLSEERKTKEQEIQQEWKLGKSLKLNPTERKMEKQINELRSDGMWGVLSGRDKTLRNMKQGLEVEEVGDYYRTSSGRPWQSSLRAIHHILSSFITLAFSSFFRLGNGIIYWRSHPQ